MTETHHASSQRDVSLDPGTRRRVHRSAQPRIYGVVSKVFEKSPTKNPCIFLHWPTFAASLGDVFPGLCPSFHRIEAAQDTEVREKEIKHWSFTGAALLGVPLDGGTRNFGPTYSRCLTTFLLRGLTELSSCVQGIDCVGSVIVEQWSDSCQRWVFYGTVKRALSTVL